MAMTGAAAEVKVAVKIFSEWLSLDTIRIGGPELQSDVTELCRFIKDKRDDSSTEMVFVTAQG